MGNWTTAVLHACRWVGMRCGRTRARLATCGPRAPARSRPRSAPAPHRRVRARHTARVPFPCADRALACVYAGRSACAPRQQPPVEPVLTWPCRQRRALLCMRMATFSQGGGVPHAPACGPVRDACTSHVHSGGDIPQLRCARASAEPRPCAWHEAAQAVGRPASCTCPHPCPGHVMLCCSGGAHRRSLKPPSSTVLTGCACAPAASAAFRHPPHAASRGGTFACAAPRGQLAAKYCQQGRLCVAAHAQPSFPGPTLHSACRPRKYWHVQPAPAARPAGNASWRQAPASRQARQCLACQVDTRVPLAESACAAGRRLSWHGPRKSRACSVTGVRRAQHARPFLGNIQVVRRRPRASSKRRSSTSKGRACSLLRHWPYCLTRPHAVPAPLWRPRSRPHAPAGVGTAAVDGCGAPARAAHARSQEAQAAAAPQWVRVASVYGGQQHAALFREQYTGA